MKRYLLGYSHPSCRIYTPKVNKIRQAGLVGFLLSAVVADGIIPCTFGQITRGAYNLIKRSPIYLYK